MTRIVDDLLQVSMLDAQQTMEQEPVELHALLEEVRQSAKVTAGNRDVKLRNGQFVTVMGNREQLRGALINLVDNAIKYTPDGGSISISLDKEDRWAKLHVVDSGIGIPSHETKLIFDRFYRVDKARSRAKGGTGLGLAIVKEVAEVHGGKVTVKSSPGKGSAFTVWLPL